MKVWQYLKESSGVVPRFLSGVSRRELLHLYLVINVTGSVEQTQPGLVWKRFLVTSYLHLPLRTSCCRVSLRN